MKGTVTAKRYGGGWWPSELQGKYSLPDTEFDNKRRELVNLLVEQLKDSTKAERKACHQARHMSYLSRLSDGRVCHG